MKLQVPGEDLSFDLPPEGEVRIGRSGDNDIQLEALSVSRRHCVIYTGSEGLYIEDAGSSNGTYVGGTLISRGARVRIMPGNTLRLGTYRMLVTEDGN